MNSDSLIKIIGPEKAEVLAKIGATLLIVQMAEKIIDSCLLLVLQKDGGVTLEDLEKHSETSRRKTLGQLLTTLRWRANLHPKFSELLDRFLKNRNILAHKLNEDMVPGWSLDTPEGRAVAHAFIDQCGSDAEVVISVFFGLLMAWREKVNIGSPPPKDNELVRKIEEDCKPLVDLLFFKKETT